MIAKLTNSKIFSRAEAIFKTASIHFFLGEPFSETTLDMREVEAIWTLEENGKVLKTVHKDKKSGIVSTLERTMEEDGEVQRAIGKCGDEVCVNIFRRIKK